ncbi:formylglycine-generating enzyme family protein, partial [Limnospira sp.]
CADPWHDSYNHDSYNGAPSDGRVWDVGNDNRYQNPIEYLVKFLESKDDRVLRGGSWDDLPESCRCAFRDWVGPDILNLNYGFRVACAPPDS